MNRIVVGPRPGQPLNPSASRRATAKARTRSRLVDAARSLFMERGYEAATIRAIASRAGLSTGAVFASFSDKSDLFNAVMADDHEKQIVLIGGALTPDAPVEQSLLELTAAAYRFHLDRLPLLQAATGLSWSHGLSGPLGHRPIYGRAIATMSGLLKRAAERGELGLAINIELLAEMLWDCYLANYRHALFDGWGLDQLMARMAEQVRLLLAGAGAQTLSGFDKSSKPVKKGLES